MSPHSWPLFYFKRLLALLRLSEWQSYDFHGFYRAQPHFPMTLASRGNTLLCSLPERIGTVKLIPGQAAPVSELLLQLGPLSSTVTFLLCFLAFLEFHPLPLLVPNAMRQWYYSMWTHSEISPWVHWSCHRIPWALSSVGLPEISLSTAPAFTEDDPSLHTGLRQGTVISRTGGSLCSGADAKRALLLLDPC